MNSEYFIDPNINSGRFAELEELEADYKRIRFDDKNEKDESAAGIVIDVDFSDDGEITGGLVDGSDTSTIIVSSPGSGKTRKVLSPYGYSCINAGHSFIAHDPKGELFDFFNRSLNKYGYRTAVITLRDPSTGDGFNYIQIAAELYQQGKRSKAIGMVKAEAQTLYGPLENPEDPFWTNTAIKLFICYFVIACEIMDAKDVSLASIYRIHLEGLVKMGSKTRFKRYLDANEESPCYSLGISIAEAPNDTRESIFAVFSEGLTNVVLNDEVGDLTANSTIDIDQLSDESRPMALFIITKDEAPKTYSTIVSSMIDTIYTSLIEKAQARPSKKLPRPVHFILEEFGNLSKLENINDMVTASRSRGIRICAVVQSLCQLYITYNADVAKTLIGSFQNLVYMSSTDMELVKMISERCGTFIDPYTHESRDLLSPDRLMHLDKKKGETLMLLDRHYPYITQLPDVSQYKMIQISEAQSFPEREKKPIPTGVFKAAVENLVRAENRSGEQMQMNSPFRESTRMKVDMSELVGRLNAKIQEGV